MTPFHRIPSARHGVLARAALGSRAVNGGGAPPG